MPTNNQTMLIRAAKPRRVLAVLFALCLSACGGDSDSNSTTNPSSAKGFSSPKLELVTLPPIKSEPFVLPSDMQGWQRYPLDDIEQARNNFAADHPTKARELEKINAVRKGGWLLTGEYAQTAKSDYGQYEIATKVTAQTLLINPDTKEMALVYRMHMGLGIKQNNNQTTSFTLQELFQNWGSGGPAYKDLCTLPDDRQQRNAFSCNAQRLMILSLKDNYHESECFQISQADDISGEKGYDKSCYERDDEENVTDSRPIFAHDRYSSTLTSTHLLLMGSEVKRHEQNRQIFEHKGTQRLPDDSQNADLFTATETDSIRFDGLELLNAEQRKQWSETAKREKNLYEYHKDLDHDHEEYGFPRKNQYDYSKDEQYLTTWENDKLCFWGGRYTQQDTDKKSQCVDKLSLWQFINGAYY